MISNILGKPVVDSEYAFERFHQDKSLSPFEVTGVVFSVVGLSFRATHLVRSVFFNKKLNPGLSPCLSIWATVLCTLPREKLTCSAIDHQIIDSIKGVVVVEVAKSILYATITTVSLLALCSFGTALAIGLMVGTACLLDTAFHLHSAFYKQDGNYSISLLVSDAITKLENNSVKKLYLHPHYSNSLNLHFQSRPGITAVTKLAAAIKKNTSLEELTLWINGDEEVVIEKLADALTSNTSLLKLEAQA